jgi:tetratricopeptide (TPR) repeat protein
LRKAADCFEALVKVDQGDDGSIATLDYTDYGVILAELGDAERFDRMRQEAIARFNHTGNQSVARRIVKISLLRPADHQLLASLAPLAETMVRPLNSAEQSHGNNADYNSWSKTVQALLEYRRGDYDKAADWSRSSLAMSDAPPFSISLAHLILAMALRQLGRDDAARLELQQGRDLIEIKLKNEDDQRNWRDWLFGHVLLREAAKPLPGAVQPAEPKRGAKAR